MNEAVEILLTHVLIENIMLVSLLGVTLLLTGTDGARSSLKAGVYFAVATLVAGLVGTTLANALPAQEILAPFAFLVVSLAAILWIRSSGQLQGERYGLPAPLFALPLVFGAQYILYDAGYDFAMLTAAAVGVGLGVYLVYVLACSMHEQIKLTETNSPVKGLPAFVIALGILGFAMMGFQLL